jgi:hypothetical protein
MIASSAKKNWVEDFLSYGELNKSISVKFLSAGSWTASSCGEKRALL